MLTINLQGPIYNTPFKLNGALFLGLFKLTRVLFLTLFSLRLISDLFKLNRLAGKCIQMYLKKSELKVYWSFT